MLRSFQSIFVALAVVGVACSAGAFALLGPFDTWQTGAIGYDPHGGVDIGGPMNINEGYRWSFKPITYGFDPSFIHYFGNAGSNAVVQAINILNNLPQFSKMSASLSEFPDDTMKANYPATSLGILDVKSYTLGVLLEEFGLAGAERYVWTLRDRRVISPTVTQYLVIQRNYDPATSVYSPFVNDVLYTYAVVDPIPLTAGSYADAVEFPLDPDARAFTSVSMTAENNADPVDVNQFFNIGNFYTGLTRDDIAGLRYLYNGSRANAYVQTLPAGATLSSSGGSPWSPVPGTNNGTTGTGTTNAATGVTAALRTGVDKIQLVQVHFDSVFGAFVAETNTYVDAYFTNGVVAKQAFTKTLTQPDILFAAGELNLNAGGAPNLLVRTTAAAPSFVNDAALNTVAPAGQNIVAGPGQIDGPVVITFAKIGPYIINQSPSSLDQTTGSFGIIWGSFDATTNPPVVYPEGLTLQELEYTIFGP